jgi:hypothetical protein
MRTHLLSDLVALARLSRIIAEVRRQVGPMTAHKDTHAFVYVHDSVDQSADIYTVTRLFL